VRHELQQDTEIIVYYLSSRPDLIKCWYRTRSLTYVRDDTTKLMTHAYILRLKWFQWIKM